MKKSFLGIVKMFSDVTISISGKCSQGEGSNKKVAFTLAEVLVTLGIIGVVAAMTLPALITKYQKKQTAIRLKHAYSVLFQAVKRSEVDNGPMIDWDYPTIHRNSQLTLEWVEKYIVPYIQCVKTYEASEDAIIILKNGTQIQFWDNGGKLMHVKIKLYPNSNLSNQRNLFIFFIGETSASQYYGMYNIKPIRPYDYALSTSFTRNDLLNSSPYGCKSLYQYYCSGLIMYDGWEIKDDYPW